MKFKESTGLAIVVSSGILFLLSIVAMVIDQKGLAGIFITIGFVLFVMGMIIQFQYYKSGLNKKELDKKYKLKNPWD
jgi:membrane-bound ClpP family serine protease